MVEEMARQPAATAFTVGDFIDVLSGSPVDVSPRHALYPRAGDAFGAGLGLEGTKRYSVEGRGEYWTDDTGAIRGVRLVDPVDSLPDLDRVSITKGCGDVARLIVVQRSNSTQMTVFCVDAVGSTPDVWSCNRDPGLASGTELGSKTAEEVRRFRPNVDRGHLEERSAGGGPWTLNLDAQGHHSNQGRTRAWLTKNAAEVDAWARNVQGNDPYKGRVYTYNMREFERHVALLVKKLPGRVTVRTRSGAFDQVFSSAPGPTPGTTILGAARFASREADEVLKDVLIDGRPMLPYTSRWTIETSHMTG